MSRCEITNQGSNVTTINQNGTILFFSYSTLVGLRVPGKDVCFFQKDGKAASRTTAKHITQWIAGRPSQRVSEDELDSLANGSIANPV